MIAADCDITASSGCDFSFFHMPGSVRRRRRQVNAMDSGVLFAGINMCRKTKILVFSRLECD